MKPILNIAILLLLPAMGQAQMVIQSGATLKTTGNALIALQDINLVNNGTLNQQTGEGKFSFSGTQANTISGTAINTQFDSLLIAKTGTGKVTLQQNIAIGSGLRFTSGKIDMLDKNINLLPTANLVGETETSNVGSTSTGQVTITQTLNAPVEANPGNLGAVITSTQNMGSTVVKRGHVSQVNASSVGSSVLRYYDITPANNAALNATLRINYLDQELNGITEADLNAWRSTDNVTWQNQGYTTRNATTNYVEKAGIASFSRWTLSSLNNPLPLDFTSFTAACIQGNISLQWVTAQETNVDHFEIEHSTTAVSWRSVGYAAFTAGTHQYSFKDANKEGYYRIVVVSLDGTKLYSDVQHAACNAAGSEVTIWPNPATENVFVKLTATASNYIQVKIYDAKGSVMSQQTGQLIIGENQVSVDLSRLAKGMYWLNIEWDNGANRKSVQVVKQ